MRSPSVYVPAEGQGLRLLEALCGEAQRKIIDEDDEDLYLLPDGVTRLWLRSTSFSARRRWSILAAASMLSSSSRA